MGQLPGPPPDFASFYREPNIERMHRELTDHEFEHFVGYVFEQAGYFVEDTAFQRGAGIDLKLYTGSPPAQILSAGVQVKELNADALVTAPEIVKLRGGVAGVGGVPGYFVTTSGFVGPALVQANGTPRVWPIDGAHFLRYINYVRGTRALVGAVPHDELAVLDQEPMPIAPESILIADTVARRFHAPRRC